MEILLGASYHELGDYELSLQYLEEAFEFDRYDTAKALNLLEVKK
jgi:tetratricopeptide (TPR) repeat protein